MEMQDGLGYDWSYVAQEEPTEFALMAYTLGSDTEIVAYQLGIESIEAQLTVHQKNEVVYEEKITVLEFKDKDKANDRLKKGDGYHAVPSPHTRNYMPPLANLSFAGLDDSLYRPIANKNDASISKGETSVTQTRNINSEDSQTTVKPSFKKIKFTKARNESVKSDKQADKPRIVIQNPKVDRKDWNVPNTMISKGKVNTVRVNGVNTAGQIAVSTVEGNGVTAIKASAGNKALLTDYQDLDGGFVAFGRSTKGDKILGIGKIRTNKIDFEDVFFAKELKFNLFSVSQMCDKKNSILFTETECLVVSPNFKLLDENLACLFEKATTDESRLWHRRLGHVKFKIMNKLMKGNLVRGLPLKTFENDHTCVACQNGKQPKASCLIMIEAARTMLADSLLPTIFWVEAVNIASYVPNRVLVTKPHNKIPYELIIGRPPSISFMRPFGCPIIILNTLDPLDKFYGKAEEGFLVGYYKSSDDKVGDVETDDVAGKNDVQEPANEYDQALKNVLDRMINQEKEATKQLDAIRKEFEAQCNSQLLQDNATRTFSSVGPLSEPPHDPLMPELEDTVEIPRTGIFGNAYDDDDLSIPTTRIHSIHPKAQNIRDPKSVVQTRGKIKKSSREHAMISYIQTMQEVLLQFKIQKVWSLVDLPSGKKAIGTKWVYRNKKDKRGIVVRNKARLVAQGYKQEEGIDMMRFLLLLLGLKQSEEVYVCQPPGFVDPEFPNKVYKVEKAMGQIDKTLFIKRLKSDILLVQVYVDDIIFGSTKTSLCDDIEQIMHNKFQMSSIGELTFFLGLQVKLKENGVFISQDKYIGEILKKFDLFSIRSTSTSMETHKALTKDEDGEDVDVHLYISMIGSLMYLTSSRPDIIDYAGASLDRKSTIGGCQFLSSRHHFIRDSYEKKLIEMVKIHTNHNVVDLLTKAFDVSRFNFLMVGDEAVYKELGDRIERAATTAFSLETEQDSGLEFCDKHNMVAYLEKSEGSEGFYQIIDFLSASHIQYALIENLMIYASFIKQFWRTATAGTNAHG
ncbi:putative ribonuclease H-like domain-containing protein [Tanacetum coccineum]|uniref:Ribonuclease H-like domain-containing protein n=1 Tax=Tanacetum coccineum TaxID=301880 RepID=A0ABQ5FE45_9ASTR